MQSRAATVDEYLAELPEERREALTRLREMCVAELPGFTEAMTYGMPTYDRTGADGIAFASQKRYISVYVNAQVRAAHAEELAAQDMGKSCLRFTGPERIDFDLVRRLLRTTATSAGPLT